MNDEPAVNAEDVVDSTSYHHLHQMYPFFEESRHLIRQTTRYEMLFRDFGFRGLTIRGPHTNLITGQFSFSELDTTPPNRLIWIPTHNEHAIYFHEIDFSNPVLQQKVLMVYDGIVIGDSATQGMPLSDIVLPIFPCLPPNRIYALSTLQLYGCIYTQTMLDAIATFPVGTLVLTGYAYASSDQSPCVLSINGRVRILMLSVLSRYSLQINLANIVEMDYLCLGGSISTKTASVAPADSKPAGTNVGPVLASYNLLVTNTLCELYQIVEGKRTNVKTLALLISTCDMTTRNARKILMSLDHVYKIILGYNSCGIQCPIRTMQHTMHSSAVYAGSKPKSLTQSEGSSGADTASSPHVLDVFACCAEKGVRHFAFDSVMSAHLEGAKFETFAPYIDTLECQFMVGTKNALHLPLVFSSVPSFDVFRWGEDVLQDSERKTMQRLTPPSGKALRSVTIDKRLEWLGSSYIVVNCSNVVSMPKEGVHPIDEKAQRSMLRDSNASSSGWFTWIPFIS